MEEGHNEGANTLINCPPVLKIFHLKAVLNSDFFMNRIFHDADRLQNHRALGIPVEKIIAMEYNRAPKRGDVFVIIRHKAASCPTPSGMFLLVRLEVESCGYWSWVQPPVSMALCSLLYPSIGRPIRTRIICRPGSSGA